MSGPAQRRRDPQPVSRAGELALLAVAAGLLLLAFGALVGLGLASAVFGRGWVWPAGGQTLNHTLGGLLAGHPGRGLPPPLAALVPSPGLVYLGVGVAEGCLLAAAVGVGWLVAGYVRPGDARGGMATRGEAHEALGVGQLRRAKKIIRPDLYPAARSTPDRPGTAGEGSGP